MPSSVALGNQLETTIKQLVATGRFHSKSEVIREGIRLVDEREKRLAAIDASLARGLADADAGRVLASQDVFGELRARYSAKAKSSGA